MNTAILALDGFTEPIDPFTVGEPLLRRPRNAAGFNATWTKKRLMLNMNGTIRGAVLDVEPNDGTFACELGLPCLFRNPGYRLLNAGFAYQLPKGIEIYGRINNFLNQKYEEAFGFPSLAVEFHGRSQTGLASGRPSRGITSNPRGFDWPGPPHSYRAVRLGVRASLPRASWRVSQHSLTRML